MNHLLAHAATSRILGVRPLRQIFVAKLAPHAQYLYALGLVRFHHEVVLHARLLARPLLRRAFSLPLIHASIRPYGSGASWNAVCEASTKRPRVKSCNEPASATQSGDQLVVRTKPKTDYWRKTFYDYVTDNGHFFFLPVIGDFALESCVAGKYGALYDQAGLMVRIDSSNWLKCGL